MSSAFPYNDPPHGGQDPGALSSHMAPTRAPSLAAFLQPPHLLPAWPPKTCILGLQVSVTLMPRPKQSLHPEIQAEL